jgi:hypothetical protein
MIPDNHGKPTTCAKKYPKGTDGILFALNERQTSRQNPTPTVYPDLSEQQYYGSSGESHQRPYA